MSDEVSTAWSLRDTVTTIITLLLGYMGYSLKKRDDKIDEVEKSQNTFEKKVLEQYATKDSMRAMFSETQRTISESTQRVEKQVDEMKNEARDTNKTLNSILLKLGENSK